MATVKSTFETTDTLTITLASLGNGSGRASTAIDNTSNNDLDGTVLVKIKTNAAGTSATGHIDVYVVKSADGTTYDDSFGGTDGALTPSAATFLFSFPAVANATTYVGSERISKVFDRLPKKFAICIVNNSGAALDSTAGNHAASVTRDYLTVA